MEFKIPPTLASLAAESLFTNWRRASECADSTCVEVARSGSTVAVRDSKTPEQAALRYTVGEWAAFIAGVKAGEFDDFAFGD